MLEGSSVAPANKKGTSTGFIASTGAVGCGYYACTKRTSDDCSQVAPLESNLQCPSHSPYTIATGTTGGAFFAELYSLTRNRTYADVAKAALEYEAGVTLSTGEVPYILDGINCSSIAPNQCMGEPDARGVGGPWTYDTISYVTEAIAAVAIGFPQDERPDLRRWKSTVDFLVHTQGRAGYWGTLRRPTDPSDSHGDIFRSPRCLTLLSWWLTAIETPTYKDEPVRQAIRKYLIYLLGKGGSPRGEYGMMSNMVTHGMVGLAVADAIHFGVTF